MTDDTWAFSTPHWQDRRNAAGFAAEILRAILNETILLEDAPLEDIRIVRASEGLIETLQRLSKDTRAETVKRGANYVAVFASLHDQAVTQGYTHSTHIRALRYAFDESMQVGVDVTVAAERGDRAARMTYIATDMLISMFNAYAVFSNIDVARARELEIPWRLRDVSGRRRLPRDYVAAFEAAWAVGHKMFAYEMVQGRKNGG